MLPTARVCHSISGRLRIRIDAYRRDEAFFGQLSAKLERVPGVLRVEANPITATVLIQHTLDAQHIRREIESRACVSLAPGGSGLPPARSLSPDLGMTGGSFANVPRVPADARGLAILALFGMAIHQAIEGNVMVPAVSLLWYAFNLLERRDYPG